MCIRDSSDPLGSFSWKLNKNREWIVVDRSIKIVDTSLPSISFGEGNGLVFSLKPEIRKQSKPDGQGLSL